MSKLIVSGATGFVGQKVVLQALANPSIASVVALSRKPVEIESGTKGSEKLKHVAISDYAEYSPEVKKELAGANGFIWTVAVTPMKSKDYSPEEVKKICHDSPLAAIKAVTEAGVGSPFRFIYMSGAAAERDQTKTPPVLAEYALMRGETENQVLAHGATNAPFEVCVVRPGFITGGERQAPETGPAVAFGKIDVNQVAAAMVKQVTGGIEKDTLTNDDMLRIAGGAH